MRYLFGDTDIAAHRLEVLAEVFAESSRSFLLGAEVGRPELALDLGCGPGFSTLLVADVLHCYRAAGLDSSDHFISLARKTESGKVSFHLHDVTSVPFPVGPADLIYCRLLLTHMKDLKAVVAQWTTQLCPKGFLLIEEVERINTNKKVFVDYLKILQEVMEHEFNGLYLGSALNILEDTDLLRKRSSEVRRVPVTSRDAATMFFLNVQAWRRNPFILKKYPSLEIDRLERALGVLRKASGGEIEIEWEMRQIVFERG
ncbi:MAG: class I SAM-dependent methyltransferase [Dehalococcoidia bacterium]